LPIVLIYTFCWGPGGSMS